MLGTVVPRPFDKPRCQRASGEQPELTVTVIGKLALVQGANFRHLNTNSSVMLNVRKEMALVRPGVQIEDLASFVHLDEGNDVRPAVCVHRADMGGHMPSQELARIRISHLTFPTKHLATQIIVNGSLNCFIHMRNSSS